MQKYAFSLCCLCLILPAMKQVPPFSFRSFLQKPAAKFESVQQCPTNLVDLVELERCQGSLSWNVGKRSREGACWQMSSLSLNKYRSGEKKAFLILLNLKYSIHPSVTPAADATTWKGDACISYIMSRVSFSGADSCSRIKLQNCPAPNTKGEAAMLWYRRQDEIDLWSDFGLEKCVRVKVGRIFVLSLFCVSFWRWSLVPILASSTLKPVLLAQLKR